MEVEMNGGTLCADDQIIVTQQYDDAELFFSELRGYY